MDTVQLKQMEPIFGSWYVDREIGSGSFGKVYSIYKDDAGFRFKAALKVISIPNSKSDIQELDAQGFDHAAKVRYFDNISAGIMEEIRIMNTLRGYTNIVCFEDYQTIMHPDGVGRDILIRMELLERLDSYMQRIRATQYDVVAMLRDITQALVLCDKKNIIHRDIKPDNIMVSENGDYKLVDFGIARNMERTSQASTKAGSYPYMAPEVQMHQPYGKSVDIYSLGVVAYRELNAYRYPFLPPYPQPFTAEERDMALYRRFKGEKIPPIPGVSKQLFAIIEKCIAHRPEQRYNNPQDLLNDLNAVLAQPDLRKKRLFDDAGNMLPPYNGKEFNPKSMMEPSQGRSQKGPGTYTGTQTGTGSYAPAPGAYPPGTGTGSYARSGYYPGPAQPGPGPGTIPPGTGTYSQSAMGSVMVPPPKKSGGKKVAILLVVLLLLAAGGAVAYMMLRPKNETPPVSAKIQMNIVRTDLKENADPNTFGAQSGEDVVISGTARPDTDLVLSYSGNSQTVRTGNDGTFSFSINSALLPANAETEMTVRYADSSVSDEQEKIRVTRDGYCALVVNEGNSDANWITGTADPFATVYVEGSTDIIQADRNGYFALQNTSGAGVTLTLRADDLYGNTSDPIVYNVPAAPVELTIQCSAQEKGINGSMDVIDLSGKGPEEGEIFIRVNNGGNFFYSTTIPVSGGEWTVPDVDVSTLQGEGTLYMKVEWADKTAENSVPYDRSCSVTLDLASGEELTTDTSVLTGRADPNSQVVLRNSNGELFGSIPAGEDGSFALEGLHLQTGDTLVVTATDPAGNEATYQGLSLIVQQGTKTQTAAADDNRADITLEVSGISEGDIYTGESLSVSGRAEPESDMEVTIGRSTVATFRTDDGGNYSETVSLKQFEGNRAQDLEVRVLYRGTEKSSGVFRFLYDTGITNPEITEPVTEATTVIRGKADPGDRVFVAEASDAGINPDAQFMEGTADLDGNFEIRLDQPLRADRKYAFFAQDSAAHMTTPEELRVAEVTRIPVAASVKTQGRELASGDRVNQNMISVQLTDAEEGCDVTLRVQGNESGRTIERPLKGTTVLNVIEMKQFTDGETLSLTAFYSDWDETRSPFTMNLVYDVSAMNPELDVSDLTPDLHTISGTAEPGSTVTLRLEGTRESHEEKAGEDGRFAFENIPLKSGQTWSISAKDALGNTSDKTEYTVRDIAGIAINREASGIVNGLVNGRDDYLRLTGSAEGGRTIEVRLNTLDGDVIAGGPVSTEDGSWTAQVPKDQLPADQKVTLWILYSGQTEVVQTLSFTYDPACREIELAGEVSEDTEIITGTTEPDIPVTLWYGQVGEISGTRSDANGEFRMELPEEYRVNGYDLMLFAEDAAGNQASLPVPVQPTRRTAIQIDRSGLTEYAGTYLVGAETSQVTLNGTGAGTLRIRLAVTDALTGNEIYSNDEIRCEDGQWNAAVSLPDSWDTLRIRAEYADGKYNDQYAAGLELKYDGECVLESATPTLVETAQTLRVISEPGAAVEATFRDAPLQVSGPDEENGFTIFLPGELQENDSIQVTATDPAGNRRSMPFVVSLEDRPVPNLKLAEGDTVNQYATELHFEGDNAMAGRALTLKVGDRTFDGIMPNENGAWSRTIPVSELNLKDGTVYYEIGYSDRGMINSRNFVYDSEIILKIHSTSVNEDTTKVNGETEPGSTVRLTVGSNSLGEMTAADGKFEFSGLHSLNAGDVLTFTAEDEAGNRTEKTVEVKIVSRQPVTVTTPEIPENRIMRTGNLYLGGKAGGDKQLRIIVREDGTEVMNKTTRSSGSGIWTINPTGVTTKDGKEYEIETTYADGKSTASNRSVKFTADGKCEEVQLPERITDSDTSITGRTEKNATVHLSINGAEQASVQANGNGQFSFNGLVIACDDRIEVYAQDTVGNRSGTAVCTAETDKQPLWMDGITLPAAKGSTATDKLNTRGEVFSHEKLTFYYTLESSDGSASVTVRVAGKDLEEETDRDEVLKLAGNLAETYSTRYYYYLDQAYATSGINLDNGEYNYTLYAETESGTSYVLHEAKVTLANPDKEETIGPSREYVSRYTNPKFIAGLDELVRKPFPADGIFFTGWIWAKEGTFEDPEIVYYELKSDGSRWGLSYTRNGIEKEKGIDRIVYRNIAQEQPSLRGQYSNPYLEQAGFVVWIPMKGDLQLDPGTHSIEVCIRDNKNPSLGDMRIGVYEITIGTSGSMDGATLAENKVISWDDRVPEEEEGNP